MRPAPPLPSLAQATAEARAILKRVGGFSLVINLLLVLTSPICMMQVPPGPRRSQRAHPAASDCVRPGLPGRSGGP